MDSAEFTEWQAYYRLEPFGDLVADRRHGIATAALVNVSRASASGTEPFTEENFIPWRDKGAGEDGDDDESELIELEDPVAQSNLIRAAIFGLPPRQ